MASIRWFLLLALSAPAFASARDRSFLVHVDGAHVGEARWERRADDSYRETLRIETAQLKGRSDTVDALLLERDGDGWAWKHRLETGAVTRRESGRIGNERVARDGVVLPMQVAERVAAATGDARFVQLDPMRASLVETALSACAVATDLPRATRCIRLLTAHHDERWHFGADAQLLRIDREWAGLPMSLVPCSGLACQKRVAKPLDVVGRFVVDSPVRIPRRLAQAKLRYVLTHADGTLPELVGTGEQAVVASGTQAVVTVCKDCGAASAETPESLAPFLAPNAWVRSDDPRLRVVAERARIGKGSVHERMQALSALVRGRMSKGTPEFLGYADAVQAWRTRRGDCTEYAVLLAALARAQGLPARVAVGMVYSSRFTGHKYAFSPHAWVQVYTDGRWVSYDAAYEVFDSTHVALATGTGDPVETFDAFVQLQQLRIEKVGEVR